MKEEKVASARCPVCNYRTLSEPGTFEICPVCYWEDEGEIANADEPTGGPNGDLSLNQARSNFQQHGAVDERFIGNVRRPLPEEM